MENIIILPKKEKIINKKFFSIWESQVRYLLLYGGRGSSKSNFAAKKLIKDCLKSKYLRGILVRDTYSSIKDSQFQTIKDIIYEWGLESLFHFKENPLEIHCLNGNIIYARGCDDVDKIKSIKDPSYVWYEEANNISQEDFITITTSVRTSKAEFLQEILSFNPECTGNYEDFWIWQTFIEPLAGYEGKGQLRINIEGKELTTDYEVHHSTYHDNRWITPEFIAQMEQLRNVDPYYYDVYCLGIWGQRKALSPFFSAFDKSKHIGECSYDPRKTLYISIDFNLNPFSVSFYHLWKDAQGEHLHNFDEFEIFNGSIPEMARRINEKYLYSLPNCKITGDAMGNRGDISQMDNASLYMQLVRLLKGVRISQLFTPANPTHENSRADCNYFLTYFPDFKVHPNCKGMIRDMQNVQVDAFGSIIKRNRKDVNQRGDYADCFVGETLVITNTGEIPIKDITIGDVVKTKNGYNKVVDCWSSYSEVYEFTFSDGSKIECTKDHRFFVHNMGYLPIFSIFENKLNIWKELSYTTGAIIESTSNKNITTLANTKGNIQDVCTGKCGTILMGKYQMVTNYTIKTGMRLITRLKILNWLKGLNTQVCTPAKDSKKTPNIIKGLWKEGKKLQRFGISQKKGLSGIGKMPYHLGLGIKNTAKEIVSFVKRNILQGINGQDFALITAGQLGEENSPPILLQSNAKSVQWSLKAGNTKVENFVVKSAPQHQILTVKRAKLIGLKKVYDITVENEPNFYANGFLVHNCQRYLVNTFLKDWLIKHQKSFNYKK